MAKRQKIDQWELAWQKYWAEAGTTYELPAVWNRLKPLTPDTESRRGTTL